MSLLLEYGMMEICCLMPVDYVVQYVQYVVVFLGGKLSEKKKKDREIRNF